MERTTLAYILAGDGVDGDFESELRSKRLFRQGPIRLTNTQGEIRGAIGVGCTLCMVVEPSNPVIPTFGFDVSTLVQYDRGVPEC